MTNINILLAILVAALATWLPRIFPFFLVRWATLPAKVLQFFTYLPISIIFALLLSSVISPVPGQLPQVKIHEALALIPTGLVMVKTKNVLLTVLVGVLTMALLRAI